MSNFLHDVDNKTVFDIEKNCTALFFFCSTESIESDGGEKMLDIEIIVKIIMKHGTSFLV